MKGAAIKRGFIYSSLSKQRLEQTLCKFWPINANSEFYAKEIRWTELLHITMNLMQLFKTAKTMKVTKMSRYKEIKNTLWNIKIMKHYKYIKCSVSEEYCHEKCLYVVKKVNVQNI